MKALSPYSPHNRMLAAGRAAEAKIVERTLGKFVWALDHAAEANDDGCNDAGVVPEGWTEEQKRWVMDLRRSKRNAPFHVLALADIYTSRMRAEAALAEPPKVSLNIGQIIQVQPRELKVIDVKGGDE